MTTEHRYLEVQLARLCGELDLWAWINTGSAMRQHGSGMADALILGKRAMFIELKSRDGRRTTAQVQFGIRVQMLGFEYHVYRQQHFDDGTVRKDLEAIA